MSTKEACLDCIRGALAALGAGPHEWAAALCGLGCRGERGASHSCPLAVYLTRALAGSGLDARASVTEARATAHWAGGRCAALEHPGLHDFVTRFDFGHYPQLELARELA